MPEEGASLAAKMGEGGEVVDDTYTPCQQLIRGKKKKKSRATVQRGRTRSHAAPALAWRKILGLPWWGAPNTKEHEDEPG